MTQAQEKKLYDTDFNLWIQETVTQLKTCNFSQLDVANLIEEVESLGKKDKRSLKSFLIHLLEHLLKRCYVPMSDCYRAWEIEIRNFRQQIALILQDSPSLNNFLLEILEPCYQTALNNVQDSYTETIFPKECPFPLDVEEILSNKFWLKI